MPSRLLCLWPCGGSCRQRELPSCAHFPVWDKNISLGRIMLYTCDSSRNYGGLPFPSIPWEEEQVGTWLPFQAEPQHVLFCKVIKIRALICSAMQYNKKEIWDVLELECRLTDALVLLDYLELAVSLVSLVINSHWLSFIIIDYHWLSSVFIDYRWLSLIIW